MVVDALEWANANPELYPPPPAAAAEERSALEEDSAPLLCAVVSNAGSGRRSPWCGPGRALHLERCRPAAARAAHRLPCPCRHPPLRHRRLPS